MTTKKQAAPAANEAEVRVHFRVKTDRTTLAVRGIRLDQGTYDMTRDPRSMTQKDHLAVVGTMLAGDIISVWANDATPEGIAAAEAETLARYHQACKALWLQPKAVRFVRV